MSSSTGLCNLGKVEASVDFENLDGGMQIFAAVSSYWATRNDVRNKVGKDRYIEVFVDTPLGVSEERDVKGLYARVRRGELEGFTGSDDPYEAPNNPELTLDTVNLAPGANAKRIIEYLFERGFVRE